MGRLILMKLSGNSWAATYENEERLRNAAMVWGKDER